MVSASSRMPSGPLPDAPQLTIVLPAYNEEESIRESVEAILRGLDGPVEVLIVENGSTDRTREIAEAIAREHAAVRVLSLPAPSYGKALKTGLREAGGDAVAICNVDFYDLGFVRSAIGLLAGYDAVVGSKALDPGRDRRPAHRRLITRAFNLGLALLFGFRGTDTHGLKVFRRETIREVLPRCRTDGEIFDTEMILRCQKAGLRIREIPVEVIEKRPTRLGLLRRVPSTARDLVKLFVALHWGG